MTIASDDRGDWAALVPELLVTDLQRSRAFYCDLCGFNVRFARPEDGFLYLDLGAAQIMLEEVGPESWLTGALELPFGRGINLQIEISGVAELAERLKVSGLRPFRELRTVWYREGDVEHGQAEILVQDPDGYLLRFVEVLGVRGV